MKRTLFGTDYDSYIKKRHVLNFTINKVRGRIVFLIPFDTQCVRLVKLYVLCEDIVGPGDGD